METISIKTDSFGIHFMRDGRPHYTVMWWQIEQHGAEWWIRFLSDKLWFTERLKLAFRNKCEQQSYCSEA